MALLDIINILDGIDSTYHLPFTDQQLLAIPEDEYITKE